MKKRLLAILFVAVIAICAIGCFWEREKTFTKAEMHITLTAGFSEKEHISYTSTYVSSDVMVFTLKEDRNTCQQAGINFSSTTLMEYAKMVIKANKLSVLPTEENGLISFYYEKEVSAKEYAYYACVYKSAEGFWLIQFATLQDEFEGLKSQICKYAQSLTFSTGSNGV